MNRMHIRHGRAHGLLLMLLVMPGWAADAPWLWKVDGGTAPLWVMGSIHVATPELYPLPEAVERAFAEVQVLALENASGTFTADENAQLMQAMALPPGKTLWDVLSPAATQQVKATCTTFGIQPELLVTYRPIVVASLLGMAAASRDGLVGMWGIEQQLVPRAGTRSIVRLESFADAMHLMSGIDAQAEENLLLAGLADAEPGMAKRMYAAYRSGDRAVIEQMIEAHGKNLAPADRDSERKLTVLDRNQHMTLRLQELLADKKPCFALIGVAHLVGPDSILSRLTKAGFTVHASP